ncbi:hypothetical protein OAK75_09030 [Bacteriovoracales bacterium]|nr:hypothetical protein [Bacteriovoracales bacterium]
MTPHILFLLSILFYSFNSLSFQIELEVGQVKLHKNKVRIPGNTGTSFDTTELSPTEGLFYRLNLYVPLKGKNSLRLLYGPLEINQNGNFSNDILFDGATFSKSTNTDVLYKFNSYRLTYRYLFNDGANFKLFVGLTGKIRDAEIKLAQGNLSKSYTNVGFVPLIYLRGDWKAVDWLTLILEMDAAGASQGRAIEGVLKTRASINNNLGLSLGHRVLEGGADNDRVFTWSLISFSFLSLDFSF